MGLECILERGEVQGCSLHNCDQSLSAATSGTGKFNFISFRKWFFFNPIIVCSCPSSVCVELAGGPGISPQSPAGRSPPPADSGRSLCWSSGARSPRPSPSPAAAWRRCWTGCWTCWPPRPAPWPGPWRTARHNIWSEELSIKISFNYWPLVSSRLGKYRHKYFPVKFFDKPSRKVKFLRNVYLLLVYAYLPRPSLTSILLVNFSPDLSFSLKSKLDLWLVVGLWLWLWWLVSPPRYL